MEIVTKKISDLKPYANNPRHNAKAVKPVKESILKFGFKVPLVIDKNNVIVCGHTRFYASKEIGLETVPCIIADDLTQEQINAFRLVDNRTSEFAEWNFDKLAEELSELQDFDLEPFGFDDLMAGLDELYPKTEEVIEDNYEEEIPVEAKTKLGDLYRLGRHYLLCGDATNRKDVERLINGHEMDLCITDSPYNVSYEEKQKHLSELIGKIGNRANNQIKSDKQSNADFYNFLFKFYQEMLYSLKKGASFYIFTPQGADSFCFAKALNDAGGRIRQQLIWVKNHFVLGFNDYHYKHEPILYGWKDGASHYFTKQRGKTNIIEQDKIEIDKLKKEELQSLLKQFIDEEEKTSVLNFDKPRSSKLHPPMKPVKLFAELIENSSLPNNNIIDFFGGSGTLLIACEQLNRNAFIMELDVNYTQVIIERYIEFTGNDVYKLNLDGTQTNWKDM